MSRTRTVWAGDVFNLRFPEQKSNFYLWDHKNNCVRFANIRWKIGLNECPAIDGKTPPAGQFYIYHSDEYWKRVEAHHNYMRDIISANMIEIPADATVYLIHHNWYTEFYSDKIIIKSEERFNH